ncbi:MAG: CDP-alcohol phosphatidyltransferase family protein [Nitrospirota bacterium]|nr:CDP-alcohol phosphatidyltransferase family protein [Nitrospirota bacterium]MDH5700052.1 CDP-alcohol phosphatidyltransferase family protein [Nitrospirota bacterium]
MDRESRVADNPINLPNSLTVLRILLVPVFVGFLLYEYFDYALVTLLVAAVTDGLDGAIARITDQRTRLGEYLDPLADKLLLVSAIVTLSVLHFIPLWAVILVVSRDAILLTGTVLANLTEIDIDIAPTWLGKGTTFAQICYVIMVILFATERVSAEHVIPFLSVMVILTTGSGVHYLFRGIQHLNSSGEKKG